MLFILNIENALANANDAYQLVGTRSILTRFRAWTEKQTSSIRKQF